MSIAPDAHQERPPRRPGLPGPRPAPRRLSAQPLLAGALLALVIHLAPRPAPAAPPAPHGAAPRPRAPTPRAAVPAPRAAALLDALARDALAANPSLAEIQARVRVARSKAAQVRAFPDPVLQVGLVNMPFWPAKFNATPMTGLQITATQVIPWPTKLSLAARVEAARARVVSEALAEARVRLGALVRATALELAFLAEEARITRAHGRILEQLISVADMRYRVNQGLLQDTLKARLARSRVDDRLERIARAREAVEARLNALLGRTPTARVPAVALPPRRRLGHTLEALLALARRHRPLLARWRRKIQVQALRRKLARTGYLPDFGVSLGYRYRQDTGNDPVNGMDFWSIGVSVRIPLFTLSRTRARIREAEAALARDRHALRNALLAVAREVRTARDAIRRLEARIRIYERQILPQARSVLKASLFAYTTGKVTFLTVLDHERVLLEHEIGLSRLRVALAQQWEALRAAVGTLPPPRGEAHDRAAATPTRRAAAAPTRRAAATPTRRAAASQPEATQGR